MGSTNISQKSPGIARICQFLLSIYTQFLQAILISCQRTQKKWNNKRQKAFEDLKQSFTTASVLAHFDLTLETWIEKNASNFVIAGILSQMHSNGKLKPVVYFSKKMSSVECNYIIYDKELLAIIRGFEI